MQRGGWRSAAFAAVLLLTGCGGGGSSGGGAGASGATSVGTSTSVPARGTLLQTPPQLLSTLTASSLLTVSGTPVCDVLMYHIEYETVGGAGEPTTASAALMVPTGLGKGCTGP